MRQTQCRSFLFYFLFRFDNESQKLRTAFSDQVQMEGSQTRQMIFQIFTRPGTGAVLMLFLVRSMIPFIFRGRVLYSKTDTKVHLHLIEGIVYAR